MAGLGDPAQWQMVGQLVLASSALSLSELQSFDYAFSTSALIIKTSCLEARTTWRRAGYLYQWIETSVDSRTELKTHLLPLNSSRFFGRPIADAPIYLGFRSVPWLPSLTVEFWEYQGELSDSPQSIQTSLVGVTDAIMRIEQSIDTRLNSVPNAQSGFLPNQIPGLF